MSSRILRLLHRIWSNDSALLLVRPAGKVQAIPQEKKCPGEIRQVTEKELADCTAFENGGHYIPIYRNMIHNGDRIHFGYLNGKCVFRHCMKRNGAVTYDGNVVRWLNQNENYMHYVYCAPEARGNHFFLESLTKFICETEEETSFAIVKANNYPSLVNFFHAGYEVHSILQSRNRFLHKSLKLRAVGSEEAGKFRPERQGGRG